MSNEVVNKNNGDEDFFKKGSLKSISNVVTQRQPIDNYYGGDVSKVPDNFKKYNVDVMNTRTEVVTDCHLLDEHHKDVLDWVVNKPWINPKFKQKFFQVENQTTPFHKLRQIFLELQSHEEAIEDVEHHSRKLPKQRRIAELKLERTEDELERVELELQIDEHNRDIRQHTRRLSQLYIERQNYLDLIDEFLASDENKTPDGQSLMTVFNTPLEDVYEQQYWIYRLSRQAAHDILSYGHIGAGNMDAITDLPEDMVDQCLALAHEYAMNLKAKSDDIRDGIAKQLGLDPHDDKITLVPADNEWKPEFHVQQIDTTNNNVGDQNNRYPTGEEEDNNTKQTGDKLEDVYDI